MSDQPFNKKENTGFKHLVNATRFSLAGLQSALKHESAFRQELLVIAFILSSGIYFARSPGFILALICTCLLVLTVELLNSGIEAAIDRVGTEYNELAKMGKDYGSAAVMLSLIIMGLTWVFTLYDGLFGS